MSQAPSTLHLLLHRRQLQLFRRRRRENVLFDSEGHMRLTDFGLAKRDIQLSQRDTACGTPLYMAPEAIDNLQNGGGYGLPVDWWMMGTLLYEMLFAKCPFEAPDMHVLWAKIMTDAVQLYACTLLP